MSFEKLVENRKGFLEQLINTLNNQFNAQGELYNKLKEEIGKDNEKGDEDKKKELSRQLSYELDNNTDYIQRIFIDSPWGSGKSYFANVLEAELKDKQIVTLKINAWETDYFSDPMKSIIGEMTEGFIPPSPTIEKMKNYSKAAMNVFSGKGIKIISRIITEIGKGVLKNKLGLQEKTIEEIGELFSDISGECGKIEKEQESELLNEYKNYKSMVENFKKELNENKDKKVIIIDELDRCKPQYAIELLETIKHIFGVRNLIFIFLVNREQLSKTVSNMYIGSDERGEYFEKFYDVFFTLPEIEFEEYIKMEYEKYEKIDTYNCRDEKGHLISRENKLIMEKLFLDVVCCNKELLEANSVRQLKKFFGKYRVLINSLSDEEAQNISLMLILTCYFIEKEYIGTFSEEIRKKRTYSPLYHVRELLEAIFLMKNINHDNLYKVSNWMKDIAEGKIKYSVGCTWMMNKEISLSVNIGNRNVTFETLKCNFSLSSDGHCIGLPEHIKCFDKAEIKISEIIKWCEEKISFVKIL